MDTPLQHREASNALSQSVLSTPSADELRYWLALLHAPGVGAIRFAHLLEQVLHLSTLFDSRSHDFKTLALPKKLRRYLRAPNWSAVDMALDWSASEHCHIISLHDARYPALLKEIPDPPPLLFVHGDANLLNQPQLAMVGSRNPSASGTQLARDFASALSHHGLTITSGLALGIDAASHLGALDAGSTTIAVAGTGLDRIYPARHRDLGHRIVEQGALVSEFPPGTPPIAHNFPRRNRIISGLSLGTLVIEAALKSGSLITARLAAEQGREVFALPGSVHNPLAKGCHALIQQGAKLTMETADILEEIGSLATFSMQHHPHMTTNPGELSEANSALPEDHPIIANMGFEPISIDELVDRSGLTAETVSSMLLTLELQGIVASNGGLYSRTN